MKVLVATEELLGRTVGKVPDRLMRGSLYTFCHAAKGELLMPLICWEVMGCQHGSGCYKSLGGVNTFKGATNFKVVERAVTLKELEDKFFASIKAQGWVDSKTWKLPLPVWQKVSRAFAGSVARAASKFPVGDVISKDSCTFWSRKTPKRNAIIRVGRPRSECLA